VTEQTLPEPYQGLGGRALTSALIAREVPPSCHPLGERNKLVMAVGLFAGTPFPCSGRLSIGAKSPLTWGIKESNVGGTVGWKLARLGLKALVFEGRPLNGEIFILRLNAEGQELLPGDEYKKLGTYRLAEDLHKKYGPRVGLLAIGPAGEMQLSSAGVAATDIQGTPCNYAGRGGMGAVLGSKGLKAVVIDDQHAKEEINFHDRKRFMEIARNFTAKLRETKKELREYGTAVEVAMSNEFGYLPTRNFRTGRFEKIQGLTGETMHDLIKSRGGRLSKPCMPGCPIKCSNVYPDAKGNPLTSSLEYETIVLLGANCGIDDLDAVAEMDRLCDDYGLDTMEMGAAIGVAMEAGLLPFGDAAQAIALLKEIPAGTPLGRIIGNGAEITGRVFGVRRVPTVRGQGMAAYDPRGIKGIGVTYMSSPMGADHTAGCAMPGRTGFDASKTYEILKPDGQEELSLDLQVMVTVFDALGLCFFIGLSPETIRTLADLHQARYGPDMTFDDLIAMARQTLKIEHLFNLRAGLAPVQHLPEFFETERLEPHQVVFDVPFETVWDHILKNLDVPHK